MRTLNSKLKSIGWRWWQNLELGDIQGSAPKYLEIFCQLKIFGLVILGLKVFMLQLARKIVLCTDVFGLLRYSQVSLPISKASEWNLDFSDRKRGLWTSAWKYSL